MSVPGTASLLSATAFVTNLSIVLTHKGYLNILALPKSKFLSKYKGNIDILAAKVGLIFACISYAERGWYSFKWSGDI